MGAWEDKEDLESGAWICCRGDTPKSRAPCMSDEWWNGWTGNITPRADEKHYTRPLLGLFHTASLPSTPLHHILISFSFVLLCTFYFSRYAWLRPLARCPRSTETTGVPSPHLILHFSYPCHPFILRSADHGTLYFCYAGPRSCYIIYLLFLGFKLIISPHVSQPLIIVSTVDLT